MITNTEKLLEILRYEMWKNSYLLYNIRPILISQDKDYVFIVLEDRTVDRPAFFVSYRTDLMNVQDMTPLTIFHLSGIVAEDISKTFHESFKKYFESVK